ncbi:glycerate kinase [Luteolibacter pohnpeiensis]|uniref:Glycerate kinase n=1 Tax=Luteolibacter pohnpeiensis TaxID=454153 RepID=A0A934VVC1_9BACT|nr:glycerate kinase [Luteolibacter pohnpeiensis]MBK1883417.1 glycerate kinase [Luteolibacter pohnpeiensis]
MSSRFLVAPDKFKGSLTAKEAADAMIAGIIAACPTAEIDYCPIADGGEGFMDALAEAMHGEWIDCPAVDALNRPIQSRYAIAQTAEGKIAIMEMAETAGIWRIGKDELCPLLATTKGVGMQIADAVLNHQVDRVILGLGGSATNDGGAGMAAALGVEFLDASGQPIDVVPQCFSQLASVDLSKRIPLPAMVAACDVENPLLGNRGATAVFSKQKGASDEDRLLLERALAALADHSAGWVAAEKPGAGAAGGLGFGLLHFTGATLESGFDLISGLLRLDERVASASHVVTGEGALDYQSLAGKGPVSLARMAVRSGVPVTAFCGMVDQEVRASGLFHGIHSLAETGLPLDELISRAGTLLSEIAERTFRKS